MIHILIVDDQNVIRQKLQIMFEQEPDFQIVGIAENGFKALDYLEVVNPDVALLDLEMSEMSGLTLTKTIRQRYPQIQIVILSSYEDRENISQAIQAGARGYLLKKTSDQEIINTIRFVQRGYFQLGPGLFEKLLSQLIYQDREALVKLEDLDEQYSHYLENLEQKIRVETEHVHQQLTQEIRSKINNLQFEFEEGLNIFQQQVSHRIQQGLDDLSKQFNLVRQNINQENQTEKILNDRRLVGAKLAINNLEKQINNLRFGLTFLLICYLIVNLLF